MPRRGLDQGTTFGGPLRTQYRGLPDSIRREDEVFGWNPRARVDWREDFVGGALNTTDGPLKIQDTSAAGAPTAALTADIDSFSVVLAATNEVETVGLTFGDQRSARADKRGLFQARVKITAAPAANERMVFGLASDYSATLGSTTINAWFLLSGAATPVLYVEADDNTTDTNTQAAVGITNLTVGTWYLLTIDFQDLGNVRYFVDDLHVGTVSMKDLGSTTLQPMILAQKDSGTGVPGFDVDYLRLSWDRV